MLKRKSRLGSKNADLANVQSITNCATGYSRVNDTGASPFQLFGKTGSIVHWRKKNCQSFRRRSTITNRPELENRRWQRQKSGSVTPTRRYARQIRCRSGQAHVGITCGSAIRTMRNDSLAKMRNVTGWAAINLAAWICTSEELSTRCCTFFTRGSGK